jgi:hypothetical protein
MAKKSQHGLAFYFFVCTALFLVYNIAGVAYNQKKHSLYGYEAIPHIDKWRQLPSTLNRLFITTSDRAIIGFAFARAYAKRKWEGYKPV